MRAAITPTNQEEHNAGRKETDGKSDDVDFDEERRSRRTLLHSGKHDYRSSLRRNGDTQAVGERRIPEDSETERQVRRRSERLRHQRWQTLTLSCDIAS